MEKLEKYIEKKGYSIINYKIIVDAYRGSDINLDLVNLKRDFKICIEIHDSFKSEDELILKLDKILK